MKGMRLYSQGQHESRIVGDPFYWKRWSAFWIHYIIEAIDSVVIYIRSPFLELTYTKIGNAAEAKAATRVHRKISATTSHSTFAWLRYVIGGTSNTLLFHSRKMRLKRSLKRMSKILI